MATIQLTQQFARNSTCPPGRRKCDFYDATCSGLILEVRASGGKTYYLRYQDKRGRTRQLRLAPENDVSLQQARKLADTARRQIILGGDPAQERDEAKQVPTFAQFIQDQYLPFVRTYKRSWSTDESLLRNHLLPRLGSRYLDEIVRTDIQKLHQERHAAGAAPGSANRLLILLRYIFNLALRWEVPGVKANPCRGVPLLQENNQRERYLSQPEAQRLYQALCQSDNPLLSYIVPMLILTGARKREVLDARWEDFDLQRRIWRIAMSKSGKARHVPLSDGAVQILGTVPHQEGCPWAFANPKTGKPFVSIFYAWDTARKRAGLADVRIHDLRHSFASLLVNAGRTLYEVQHILGHTQVKTTQRYAHLSQDTLREAANEATKAVGGVMLGPVRLAPGTCGDEGIGRHIERRIERRASL